MWAKFIKSFRKDFVQLHREHCLRTHNESTSCSKCEDICPQPAIKIIDRKLQVNHLECSNCRLCVHVCPTEALTSKIETLRKYEFRIQNCETVNFACQEHGSMDVDVVLPCVSSLTPEMIMIATLYNKKVHIFWDEKVCLSCHSNWTHQKCFEWIIAWNSNSLSKEKIEMNSSKKVKKSLLFNHSKTEFQLFRYKINEGRGLESLVDKFDQRNILLNKLPLTERRKYLLTFIKKMNLVGVIPNELADKLGLVNIRVNDHCQLCQKCSKACPTGALLLTEDDAGKKLLFYPKHCINCDICVHSCLDIKKGLINFEEVNSEIIINE